MPTKPDVVLCDLFDTVLDFDRELLPLVRVDGQSYRSSSGAVYEVVRQVHAQVTLEEVFRAFVGSFRAAEELRKASHREVRAEERVRMFFERLGLPGEDGDGPLGRRVLAAHTAELVKAMVLPPGNREAIERLASRYRLAIVSNFDHTPTAIRGLEVHGIGHRFERVVVSADIGWRKPRPEIFQACLDAMGVAPDRAIFVGDRPELDVAGAKGVGMACIWVNRDGESIPDGQPQPDHVVSRFPDILPILDPPSGR